ncbi:hypothetical protein [Micromonospora sp. LOL_021]|uniref:hypothetical protein n=1 Tax=Micromonospora sp. LOL_021 TaxID=3345417 RepID=UPI003A84A5BF
MTGIASPSSHSTPPPMPVFQNETPGRVDRRNRTSEPWLIGVHDRVCRTWAENVVRHQEEIDTGSQRKLINVERQSPRRPIIRTAQLSLPVS